MYDKRQPYESDIRVPLIIKGPGINHGTIQDPVLNIDLAPTIITLAGLKPPKTMDGKPINVLSDSNTPIKERNMLIEYFGERNIRSIDSTCPWKYDDNLAVSNFRIIKHFYNYNASKPYFNISDKIIKAPF